MRFRANRFRRLWGPCATTVTVVFGMGEAMAEPPGRDSLSGVAVVAVNDEPWRTTADEVGEYVAQLERHLDWMQRRAEVRKDTDTLTAIEKIRKKLAVAQEHHRELCRLCEEQLRDTALAKDCCQKIDDVMHEVIDDHLALMRRLRARRGGPPRNSR